VITFKEKGKSACIVVDGGEDENSADALSMYLQSKNVQTIDLMVGTHIDSDHINGLKIFVQEQVKKKKNRDQYIMIKEFWGPMPSEESVQDIVPTSGPQIGDPGYAISWQQYVIQSVKQNDDLYEALRELGATILHPALDDKPKSPFEDVIIKLLGPDTQIPADHITRKALGLPSVSDYESPISTLEELEKTIAARYEQMAIEAKRNANNQSIVFKLTPAVGVTEAKKWTFLFTGDAEEEAWDEIVSNAQLSSNLKARVLKIPHHGSSQNGITKNGANKVNPEYSVISVGQKHGLPDKETLNILQRLGSEILCTQRNQSSSHKSACYNVPKTDCPAKDNPRDINFTINTNSGEYTRSPEKRECKYNW
jgi:hypothetical protein